MKKRELRLVLDAFKRIKMPKIEDKALRNKMITCHLALIKELKKYEAELEDFRVVHLGAFDDELAAYQELQNKINIEMNPEKRAELLEKLESHKDLRDAIQAYNKAVADAGQKDVEVEKIDAAAFVAEYQKQDYDASVVEALSPLFIL